MPAAPSLPDMLAPGFGVTWVISTGLLSLRIAATFLMTPVFYALSLPTTVRTLTILASSVAIAAGLPTAHAEWSGWSALLSAAIAEVSLGATLGLGVLLAFGAFSVAGQILDVQLGFGIAQVFDPTTQRPIPILTSAFGYLAVLIFFLIDGHHALLRGIGLSIERFPIGAPWSAAHAALPLLKQAAGLFALGFALAAPVVFCILLVEFVLGVVGRNLPQMNMFAMGIPVKIIAGLIALSMWFTGIGGVMTRVYAGIATTWDQMFAAVPVRPEQVR